MTVDEISAWGGRMQARLDRYVEKHPLPADYSVMEEEALPPDPDILTNEQIDRIIALDKELDKKDEQKPKDLPF